MIDICDFAVGLSRQLYGLTIATERPEHRMMETWHPLGVCGVISAFNFPVAVWSWNAALAFVCGDPVVWKPSEKTPLTALAVQAIVATRDGAVRRRARRAVGGSDRRARRRRGAGRRSAAWPWSARPVRPRWAARSGRASPPGLPAPSWSLAATTPRLSRRRPISTWRCARIAFAAMGTAGQRCTTLRRLFVADEVYREFVAAAVAGLRVAFRLAIHAPRKPWSAR